MDYNDMVAIVNEMNWKFTQMIMGLSIGIMAFSIQTLVSLDETKVIWLLFSSWGLFFITFNLGLIRMHYIIKVLTRNASQFFSSEIEKKEVKIDRERLRKTNRETAFIYRSMMTTFLLGLIGFALFRILNL